MTIEEQCERIRDSVPRGREYVVLHHLIGQLRSAATARVVGGTGTGWGRKMAAERQSARWALVRLAAAVANEEATRP